MVGAEATVKHHDGVAAYAQLPHVEPAATTNREIPLPLQLIVHRLGLEREPRE